MLRYRVFLGGQAVSMLGNGLAALAVPLLVLQLTPVFAAAGALSVLTAATGWAVGIRREPSLAASLLSG